MKIDSSVFFDIKNYMKDLKPKTFIIGARGIGKTYSSLSYVKEYYNVSEQIRSCFLLFENKRRRVVGKLRLRKSF